MDDTGGRTDRRRRRRPPRRALHRPRGRRRGRRCSVGGLRAGRGADGHLPRPRATSGTIQTYVAHGGRGAGEAVAAAELLRVPCDLDLGDAAARDEAEAAYADQARDAARRARRRRHRPGRVARAARGPRRGRGRRRPLVDARRPAARPPAHAARARRPRAAHHRRARVRGADARRGPPADGHRLRPAGRRPRLPAARRPRALPGGLRRARGRARARGLAERLDHQEASVRRFLELNGPAEPPPADRPE